MAADPVSSLFPNRPIRPLPKRRLRERLSPEVADSIQYPPLPQTMAPLFPYPYPLVDDNADSSFTLARTGGSYVEQRQLQGNGSGIGSDEDNKALKGGAANRAPTEPSALIPRAKPEHGRYGDMVPNLSAASSPDGYDPFENTNNKKRKIPTAGDSAPSGVHAVNDPAGGTNHLGATAQSTEAHGETPAPTSTPYYGSGSFASGAHNVPGPGRGRFGRPKSGKITTRPLFDSTNSWAGRNNKPRPSLWPSGSTECTGIISNAIANAEKLPPHQGQENISLLHQQPSVKRSPASTQFTFTCDSQVPGALAWPNTERRIAMQLPQESAAASQGKENWPRAPHATQAGQVPPATGQAVNMGPEESSPSRGAVNAPNQPAPAQKSSRRSIVNPYTAAAKARRRETQLANRRKPPKPEDIWICEFCEYEAIFGSPPEALVRQYEIKDRKQRQLEQQRKAQLERMKKGKHRGKKKLPAKSSNAAQDAHHAVDSRDASVNPYGRGTQGEEYYDDEYYEDEEYDPEDEIPLEASPGIPGRRDGVSAHLGGGYAVHDEGGT
ncbi:hypothetical protein MFIFM68171_02027 [Madurella fahalii]|uniref:Uncharacterized protein n=1 Tax=Madurella fahalii TaxID=1157608 RepID=A0ABQ0G245_9PEZI